MNRNTGNLSSRDRQTIGRAAEILNAWIDWQEERGIDADNDIAANRACLAACAINDFLYETLERN